MTSGARACCRCGSKALFCIYISGAAVGLGCGAQSKQSHPSCPRASSFKQGPVGSSVGSARLTLLGRLCLLPLVTPPALPRTSPVPHILVLQVCLEYLERYYFLIAFTAYLSGACFAPGTPGHATFAEWWVGVGLDCTGPPGVKRCISALHLSQAVRKEKRKLQLHWLADGCPRCLYGSAPRSPLLLPPLSLVRAQAHARRHTRTPKLAAGPRPRPRPLQVARPAGAAQHPGAHAAPQPAGRAEPGQEPGRAGSGWVRAGPQRGVWALCGERTGRF